MSRILEQQLEPRLASRLRIIQAAFESLRVGRRASSYYITEISRAINAGMLLAAVELSTTLLEIWLRDLLVIRKVTQEKIKSKNELQWLLTKYDREIEGIKSGSSFRNIVKELCKLEVIDINEKEWLLKIYTELRNPLHHGLSGRLLDPNLPHSDLLESATTNEKMLLARIFCSSPENRSEDIEKFLDYDSYEYLGEIVNFIAAHQLPKCGLKGDGGNKF